MAEAIWKSLTFRKMVLGSAGVLFLALGGLWLVDPEAFPPIGPFIKAQPADPAASAVDGKTHSSAAEVVARLQRSVETQRKYLEKLNTELEDPNSEFHRAENRFQLISSERDSARKAIADLKAAGKADEAAAREAAMKELEERWQRNRDRFNLAITQRKGLQENIAATKRQLQLDQQALDRVSGTTPDVQATATPAPGGNTPADKSTPPSQTVTAKSPRTPPASPSPPALPLSPLTNVASAAASKATDGKTPAAAPDQPANRVSREVDRARQEAKLKEEDAQKAETKAKNITERMNALNESIGRAKKLLETARQSTDHEQKTKGELEILLQQKRAAKAPESEVQYVVGRIEAAQKRLEQAAGEVRFQSDHLNELQTELSHVQAAQIRACTRPMPRSKTPTTPRRKSPIYRIPSGLATCCVGCSSTARACCSSPWVCSSSIACRAFFSRRIVQFMAQGISKRGTHKDRENRAQTLSGVFSSALSLLILGGGCLMILDEVGIPIVPLMGGAAVIGLAVAFGAQNLIKDYFSGFMVLLEDQYGINDVVSIGPISGLVEHISLRTTVLRDLEGVVHFVPHGTITTVSNRTHGWSRALFDIGIDYKENVDHVMEVLLDLGQELHRDPVFGPLILDDPEMLGVDQFSDSSVIVKFFMKTRPAPAVDGQARDAAPHQETLR